MSVRAWAEQGSRPGWHLAFTEAGGSLRDGDWLSGAPGPIRRRIEAATSQACIATWSAGRDSDPSGNVAYWASVCRKVLQRGRRPPASHRVAAVIAERAGGQRPVGDALIAAACGASARIELDPAYAIDPTYERPFWDLAARYPAAARWLVPQAPLEALAPADFPPSISRRWVDFLYCPPWRSDPLVFEIDGAGHERRAEADRERDRLLRAAGIGVPRAPGSLALALDGPFLSLLRADQARWGAAPDSASVIAVHGPATATRFGLAVVEAVLRGFLPAGGPWSIEAHDDLGLIDELAGPVLDLLRAVSELCSVRVVPDTALVNGRWWELARGATPGRAITPSVRIRLEPMTPFVSPLYATDVPEIVVRGVGVPAHLPYLSQPSVERRTLDRETNPAESLALLLSDVFDYPGFRDGQYASILQVLRGGDSVVLLPTGSGKTLIYQLAGLVMPGTTLVVDPLISLIDDQAHRLARDGIDRVAALHAARLDRDDEREAVLGAVADGSALFVLLTPERLQSQRFRERLGEVSKGHLVNLAVVDEAHCVSEWGHQFRTSYLRLARNVRRLCADADRRPPTLLALTGTASPAVLRDVLRELEIDGTTEGSLQRPADHDRPNLTYQVVAGPESAALKLLDSALTEFVPAHLGVDPASLATLDGARTVSGLVFTPHARGAHGVEQTRDHVVKAFRARGIEITADVYSGKDPRGDQAVDSRDWGRRKAQAAQRFMQDEVAILVATKAFGMGIDKPNIRYTVHAGFPSSIEAFAQEAGRAGRNGKQALCVLASALPTHAAAAALLDPAITLEERAARGRSRRDSGDLGRQLWLFGLSFPGSDEETELALPAFVWIARHAPPGGRVVMPFKEQRGEKPLLREERLKQRDRALYRLAMLGVIDDLTVDGTEVTIYLADYTLASVDEAFLAYTSRIEPGRELAHRSDLDQAPAAQDERIGYLLQLMIGSVYRIVAQSRLNALESIYRLAASEPTPERVRALINAYLSQGPAATLLHEAVTVSPVDVRRFIAGLDALPLEDLEELTGATARQLEAYPEHPLLWVASSLAEARSPDGRLDRYEDALRRALDQLPAYGVGGDDAAAGLRWLVGRLRNENGSLRWDWVGATLRAWDQTPYPDELLVPLEDEVLTAAQQGQIHPRELDTVLFRRSRRHAAQVTRLAGSHATTEEVSLGR